MCFHSSLLHCLPGISISFGAPLPSSPLEGRARPSHPSPRVVYLGVWPHRKQAHLVTLPDSAAVFLPAGRLGEQGLGLGRDLLLPPRNSLDKLPPLPAWSHRQASFSEGIQRNWFANLCHSELPKGTERAAPARVNCVCAPK